MARRAHRRRRRREEGQTELPSRTELQPWRVVRLGSNGDLNLNTSLDVDDDLLDGLGGGEEVDETLVDAHLVLVPGLGTLTVGGLTGGDVQGLGGKTDGALDLEGLGAGTVDQLRAHLLEGGDLARGEGDADLVDLRALAEILLGLLERHLDSVGWWGDRWD